MHTLAVETADGPCRLTFSRRYDRSLEQLAEMLGIGICEENEAEKPKSRDQVSYEFS